MLEELPAVRMPSSLKTGLSLPSASRLVSSRGPSSWDTVLGPFFDETSTGTISSSKAPSLIARTAF